MNIVFVNQNYKTTAFPLRKTVVLVRMLLLMDEWREVQKSYPVRLPE